MRTPEDDRKGMCGNSKGTDEKKRNTPRGVHDKGENYEGNGLKVKTPAQANARGQGPNRMGKKGRERAKDQKSELTFQQLKRHALLSWEKTDLMEPAGLAATRDCRKSGKSRRRMIKNS